LITLKEEEELLGKDPKTRLKLQEHDLFKRIGGNPQSILLIAPMLNDPQGKISLSELYRIMKSEKINQILDGDKEGMTATMRISMEAAFKRIEQDDEEALDLFFIVSMFPGGIKA
jgi:hypothetical protein